MYQPTLFSESPSDRIVNVASVPQRSPFRYPGGKTWLVPKLRQWLVNQPARPKEFIEPFAGGGIASLTVAFENLAHHVTMVELDRQVASVWKAILGEDAAWLADMILSFDLTPASVNALQAKTSLSDKELAFQTIVKNRTTHGGILAPGSGFLKNGESGRGIKSRWYPETLSRRIREIASIKDRITFFEGDGMRLLAAQAHRRDAVYLIDPPYTAAGKRAGTRLYTHCVLDHAELFRIAKSLAGDFLMTYDDASGVRDLAQAFGFDMELVAMKNTHHAKMTELLVGRNLEWVRNDTVSGWSDSN